MSPTPSPEGGNKSSIRNKDKNHSYIFFLFIRIFLLSISLINSVFVSTRSFLKLLPLFLWSKKRMLRSKHRGCNLYFSCCQYSFSCFFSCSGSHIKYSVFHVLNSCGFLKHRIYQAHSSLPYSFRLSTFVHFLFLYRIYLLY